ncbi:MAG: hypothetical protein WKG06_45730 [Segetibacter sp.]
MKFTLASTNAKELEKYEVKVSDRAYQFWERNALSIDLWSRPVFLQKLNYMHNNPVQPHWKLCQYQEEYRYSSAKFYEKGIDEFVFLSHYFIAYHNRSYTSVAGDNTMQRGFHTNAGIIICSCLCCIENIS